MLSSILMTLLIINGFILIFLIIVMQQGNEGGLGGSFGSGNTGGFFGASGGVAIIVRATWIFGFLFFLLATSTAWVKTYDKYQLQTSVEQQLQQKIELEESVNKEPEKIPVKKEK
jgi:protein translocase SecG subunit